MMKTENEETPLLVTSLCAQDESCSRRIQHGLCSGTRKVVLENTDGNAVYPLTNALVLVPWDPTSPDDDRIPCAYTNETTPTTELDGQGATLLMENSESRLSFMFAHGVQGLILRNFTVASRRVYYTLGTLVSSSTSNAAMNDGTALIQVSNPDLYPLPPCQDYQYDHWLNRVEAIIGWDAEHHRPTKTEFDSYEWATVEWLNCSETFENETNLTLLVLNFTSGRTSDQLPRAPKSILMRHAIYSHHVFEIKLSSNVLLQDIWIQSGGGMAVVTDQIQEGLVLERVRVSPEEGHVFSVAADGFHISATRGGHVRIQGCLVESQGDDGINIKSSYLEIRDWYNNTIYYDTEKDASSAWHLWQDDTVSIYSRSSFAPLANFMTTIVSKMHNDDTGQGILVLKDSLPSTVSMYDLLVNEAIFPDSVSIVNSIFRNNRARGALLKTSNVLVRNSTFASTTGPAIQAVPQCIPDGFCEGHVIRSNWMVENCTFVDNDYWKWGNGIIYIGAEVPMWTTNNDESPSLIPSASEQLRTGIQHYDLSIRKNSFHTSSCDQSALVGYGIDGLDLHQNQGCFQWTISSNCRNVQIVSSTDEPSARMLQMDPETTSGMISSGHGSGGSALPLGIFILLINVLGALVFWRTKLRGA